MGGVRITMCCDCIKLSSVIIISVGLCSVCVVVCICCGVVC